MRDTGQLALLRVLDSHQDKSAHDIEIARLEAVRLARRNGSVTAPQLIAHLRAEFPGCCNRDMRYLGAVFRDRSVWEHAGFARTGSHARHVGVWRLR